MIKSKKAVTPVVATIMVILITVVAAFVIIGIISPLISEKLNTGSECLDYDNYFYFEEEFGLNCYESTDPKVYKISVGAQGLSNEDEENILGFKLTFINQQGAEAFDVIKDMQINPGSEIKMLDPQAPNLEIPSPREVRTYIRETQTQYDHVEIYPILTNNRVCNLADSIDIRGEICEP